MIKKLRFKFILTNMALVSLVLVIVFGVLVGSTSQRLSAQSVSAMRLALEWSELDDPPRFEFGPPPADLEEDAYRQEARRNRGEDRQFMMIPVFCAALNEDSSVAALHFRDSVEVSDEVLEYIVALIGATRRHPMIEQGASPRASLAVTAMAKAAAFVQDRDYVLPEDVRLVFPDTVAHRLLLSPKAEAGKLPPVQAVLRAVPAPKVR